MFFWGYYSLLNWGKTRAHIYQCRFSIIYINRAIILSKTKQLAPEQLQDFSEFTKRYLKKGRLQKKKKKSLLLRSHM